MIILKEHQVNAVNQAKPIIISKGLVYIFGQPRIGKSLIALELIKQLRQETKLKGNSIVFTKKNAIRDWAKYQENYVFEVTNYEQVLNKNSSDYDYIIIDEAHNFGAFPKPSQRIKNFRIFCKNKPIIFLSGTPLVEGALQSYSQLSLSSFSPFKHFKNGYDFFDNYGVPSREFFNGRQVETYSKAKTELILEAINPYMIRVTYEDAGFKYNNNDDVQIITTNEAYKLIEIGARKTRIAADEYESNFWKSRDGREGYYYEIPIGYKNEQYPLENIPALAQFLHRFSGGFYNSLRLPQLKLEWVSDFIAKTSKDAKVCIMCYFKEEQDALAKIFAKNNNVTILSSTKYCEGIDLSDYDHYILYSFGYSGAKFVQLRDRIVNIEKDRETKVIIPLLDRGVDKLIYDCVSLKQNFNSYVLSKKLYARDNGLS